MKKILLILCITVIACNNNDKKEKIIVVPPNALFIIPGEPVTAAFKIDTIHPWIILDSTAALKALLKNVEDNYRESAKRQKILADTAKKK